MSPKLCATIIPSRVPVSAGGGQGVLGRGEGEVRSDLIVRRVPPLADAGDGFELGQDLRGRLLDGTLVGTVEFMVEKVLVRYHHRWNMTTGPCNQYSRIHDKPLD